MGRWTVDARELADALRTMKKLAKGSTGDGGWTFAPDELRISWAGLSLGLAARGDDALTARLSASAMRTLVKVPLPRTGDHPLRVEGDRLYVDGSFSLPCVVQPRDVPQLLPMDHRPLDVALLTYRHDAATLTAAGLDRVVADAREDRARSVRAAAEALAWLGVEASHVDRWVEAHLTAVAAGAPSFDVTPTAPPKTIVIDRDGQVDLFPPT